MVGWGSFLTPTYRAIKMRYGFHWYDSLIVAAALEANCNVLYTEDLQDGQVIDGLAIKNPFVLF